MPQAKRVAFALFTLILLPLYAQAQGPSVPLATGSPSPASAAAYQRVIEVSGHGEVRAAPDLATLAVAIETHAPTAEQAAGLNGALARKVSDALKAKLAGKGSMWTGGYSLFPQYNEPHNGKPTIVGYRAENSISIETGQLELIGPLIDAAISAGANQVNSLNYSLRVDSKARGQAIAKAAHDAQQQAQALAGALGVKLGPILKASTVAQVRPVPVARFAGAMAMNAPTPVEAGQVAVPATVSLTYSIK